ncbi:MAG: GntR family transcriptional regulator, partial [Chitinivibrionales bacterium]|nr:GntR family transcriptional regulator [Chitinivibrionales bacterium]
MISKQQNHQLIIYNELLKAAQDQASQPSRGLHYLPPLRRLAAWCTVSRQTIHSIVNSLRKEGVISKAPNRRLYWNSGGEKKLKSFVARIKADYREPENDTGYRWERLRQRIMRDILEGKYQPGHPLPSMKEMANIYNVSFRTLKKSLESICADGHIEPFKKTYLIPSLVSSTSESKIVFVTISHPNGNIMPGALFLSELLRSLLPLCTQARLHLDIRGYSMYQGPFRFTKPESGEFPLDDDDSTLGYIHLAAAPRGGREAQQRLLSFKKPCAALDIAGVLTEKEISIQRDAYYFTAAVSPACGQKVARYLIGKGHRAFAYISPFHASVWSQNRLEGIAMTCRSAGYGAIAKSFTLNNPSEVHRFYEDDAHRHCDYDALAALYSTWRSSASPGIRKSLDTYFEYLFPKIAVPKGEFFSQLWRLFADALGHNEI